MTTKVYCSHCDGKLEVEDEHTERHNESTRIVSVMPCKNGCVSHDD